MSVRLDQALARVREELDLDAQIQHEVLEELRGHLEDAIESGRARGLSEDDALAQAIGRLGLDELGAELQAAHVGEATSEGVIAAALPVLCALTLRWVVFSPDGTIGGWREILTRPAFWVISLSVLVVPLMRFTRRRYALASWAFFWILTILFEVMPVARW